MLSIKSILLPLLWNRSRNYVVNQAIQQYLAYHNVLNQKIEQGLNDEGTQINGGR
jgi:predicted transcriptional regulator